MLYLLPIDTIIPHRGSVRVVGSQANTIIIHQIDPHTQTPDNCGRPAAKEAHTRTAEEAHTRSTHAQTDHANPPLLRLYCSTRFVASSFHHLELNPTTVLPKYQSQIPNRNARITYYPPRLLRFVCRRLRLDLLPRAGRKAAWPMI